MHIVRCWCRRSDMHVPVVAMGTGTIGSCALEYRASGRKGGGGKLDERALVERTRAGDLDAYETLVRQYQTLAFRTAWLITGSAPDAEEVAQDAFVKAFYALERFRLADPFRPWFLRIVANEARNRRKALGRRVALGLRAGALAPVDVPLLPDAASLAAEERDALLHALHTLRDDDRAVIACRFFLDLSEAETATVLRCPRGTVKSRLSRAIGRLRTALAADNGKGATDG